MERFEIITKIPQRMRCSTYGCRNTTHYGVGRAGYIGTLYYMCEDCLKLLANQAFKEFNIPPELRENEIILKMKEVDLSEVNFVREPVGIKPGKIYPAIVLVNYKHYTALALEKEDGKKYIYVVSEISADEALGGEPEPEPELQPELQPEPKLEPELEPKPDQKPSIEEFYTCKKCGMRFEKAPAGSDKGEGDKYRQRYTAHCLNCKGLGV